MVGVVIVVDFNLIVLDENKNGGFNLLFESGLEVDRVLDGYGSGGFDGEWEIELIEMVSFRILWINVFFMIYV